MDIELPNGRIIQGVPEGVKKHEIAMKAIAAGLATNKDFGYEEAPKVEASFTEGVGAGLTNVKNQVGNMLGLVDDETVEEQEYLDRHMTLGNGGGGKFVGEMVATAPMGMGAGKAVGALAKAARPASKAGKYLTNTLQRGAGRAAVEGGVYGATLAGPNERGTGAITGAAFGGALGAAGTALGKTLGKGSITKITKEAEELQKMTGGTFIPLSQSAEKGMTRMIYNAFLANIPGVGSKIRGQYQHALDDLRRFAAEKAMPDTPAAHSLVNLTGKESVDESIQKLSNYWGTPGGPSPAFDSIKGYPLTVYGNVLPSAPSWLAKLVEKQGKGHIKMPEVGNTLTGAQFLSLKTTLGEIIPTLGAKAKSKVLSYQKSLDDLLKENLDPTGKGRGQAAQDLASYYDASRYYPAWLTLKKAAKKAKDNMDFNPSQLAKAGKIELAAGKKPVLQRAGELGVHALEDFPSREGLFQTLAATSPITSVVGTSLLGGGGAAIAAAFPAVVALGRIGASKGLQKYLSGQTRGQQLGKSLMEKYSKELQTLGATARQAAQILGVENAS